MFSFLKQKEMQISKITASDLYEISQIHKASFSKGWEDGAIATMLNSQGVAGLVARVSGKKQVAAFLIYRTVASEAEIITIATAHNSRRAGAGRALMQQFIRDSLSNRLDELFLEVDEYNNAAIDLYKSLGFKTVGERQGYYQADENNAAKSTALIMRLDLTA